jgi:hypothetical protein
LGSWSSSYVMKWTPFLMTTLTCLMHLGIKHERRRSIRFSWYSCNPRRKRSEPWQTSWA